MRRNLESERLTAYPPATKACLVSVSPEYGFAFFFVCWIALGVGSWLYVRSRPGAAAKRRAHRVFTVVAGLIFTAFATWTDPRAVIIVIPAVVLITWLNLRYTRFCDNCGKTITAQPFQKIAFCPRCGTALQAQGRT